MYKQIKSPTDTEIVINKSSFIGTTFNCFSEEEGKACVSEIRKKYHDATHNCWAFVADKNGILARFSDDGEPSGTAGKPILEVLKHKKLSYSGVVVTRYFGGIKLGAGGLVRAYTKSATDALDASNIAVFEMGTKQSFGLSYSEYEIIERFLKEEKVEILSVEYTDKVTITVITKSETATHYAEKIKDFTNGKAEVKVLSEGYYGFE
ncbi:MAG: YigZ family protein [Bacillota bacterium]